MDSEAAFGRLKIFWAAESTPRYMLAHIKTGRKPANSRQTLTWRATDFRGGTISAHCRCISPRQVPEYIGIHLPTSPSHDLNDHAFVCATTCWLTHSRISTHNHKLNPQSKYLSDDVCGRIRARASTWRMAQKRQYVRKYILIALN